MSVAATGSGSAPTLRAEAAAGIMPAMSLDHLTLLQISLGIGVLFAVLLTGHILRQRRNPAATLAWVLFMIAFPLLAVPAYLSFGTRKLRLRTPQPSSPLADHDASPLDRLLDSAGIPPLRPGNRVSWHADGAHAHAELTRIVDGARASLDVLLFLLHEDRAGSSFIDALAARARGGVRVRVLLDGFGAFLLGRGAVHRLRAAGVEVVWFIPLLRRPFRARSNLRNHRKLVVADGETAWLGGRNVADAYFADASVWADLSLSLAGPTVADLAQLYAHDWRFASRQPREPAPPAPAAVASARAQLIAAGPDLARDTLHETLITLCFAARRRIVLASPYLVPDDSLQQALCLAARRGVAVTLLLPARSNHRLADVARGPYLRELAAAGVRVRLTRPGMFHVKAWLVDDDALAGSANLDLRSLFLNFELMCRVRGEAEIAWLDDWLARFDATATDASAAPVGALRELVEGVVLLTAFQL